MRFSPAGVLPALAPLCLYGLAVGTAVAATAYGVERFLTGIFAAPVVRAAPPLHVGRKAATPAAAAPQSLREGRLVPTQDSWAEQLQNPAYWAQRRNGGYSGGNSQYWRPLPQPLSIWASRFGIGIYLQPPPITQAEPRRSGDGRTYRTVCVRLCDGAFFPISFSTTKDNFEDDAGRCERSCGSEARLFAYRNPGGDVEDMEDLDGRPYKKLPTAFLYKTKYDAACKCRPHPWEDASLDRHKLYALEAARAKGSKVVARDIDDLRTKVRQADSEVAAAKARLAASKADERKRKAESAQPTKTAKRNGAERKTAEVAAAQPPAHPLAPPSYGLAAGQTTRVARGNGGTLDRRASLLPQSNGEAPVVILRLGATTVTVTPPRQSRAPASVPRATPPPLR